MDPKYRPSRTLPATTSTPPKDSAKSAEEATEELEKAKAILDVVQHSARFTRAVALAKPIQSFKGRSFILMGIALPLLIVTTLAYATRSEWVFGANPNAGTAERREAYQRYAMFLVANRIERFRDSTEGRLPQTLLEIGEDWSSIGFTVVDRDNGTYELHGTGVYAEPIRYRSTQALESFLGGSVRYLRDWKK